MDSLSLMYSLDDELRDLEASERDLDFRQRITGWDCKDLPLVRSRLEEVRRLVKERNLEILKEDKNRVFMECWSEYAKRNSIIQGFPVWSRKYKNKFDLLWDVSKLRDVSSISIFLYR